VRCRAVGQHLPSVRVGCAFNLTPHSVGRFKRGANTTAVQRYDHPPADFGRLTTAAGC
jgi:hypothetical protein